MAEGPKWGAKQGAGRIEKIQIGQTILSHFVGELEVVSAFCSKTRVKDTSRAANNSGLSIAVCDRSKGNWLAKNVTSGAALHFGPGVNTVPPQDSGIGSMGARQGRAGATILHTRSELPLPS